jgi:hypothetical protein
MKKTALGGILILACLAVSCNLFFSGNTGEEGSLSFSLGEGGAYTGGSGDSAALGNVPGVYPSLGNPRIVVYDASGKALRSYAFTGDSSSREFSLPAGGPYWVDFSATVQHPADTTGDPFPFVKSFGAMVKLDAVEKGSSRELPLPLRVRETAIMAPYMPGRTDVFVPFLDFPAEYPAVPSGAFVDRDGISDPCFDFDPYGRLITTAKRRGLLLPVSGVLTAEAFDSEHEQFISSFLTDTEALAFNLRDGTLYRTTSVPLSSGYSVNPVSSSGFWESLGDVISSLFSSGELTSPLITTDEEGAFYVIKGDSIIRATEAGTVSFGIADIIDPAGQDWNNSAVSGREIRDLKALNGYLYMLVHIKALSQSYHYFAALPLESIKAGNAQAAWFAGGTSQAELSGSGSLAGFFEPKKIIGWGPERIYVYDVSGGFHRTVEVDLRSRGISRAGLVLPR